VGMQDEVKKVVDEILNPALQFHGGGVELVDVDETDGVVRVRLVGACHGCAGAALTLSGFVERELKKRVEGVKKVEAVF